MSRVNTEGGWVGRDPAKQSSGRPCVDCVEVNKTYKKITWRKCCVSRFEETPRRGLLFVGRKLYFLLLGSRVVRDVGNRELCTVAFKLLAIGNRAHRGGFSVQEVNLLER